MVAVPRGVWQDLFLGRRRPPDCDARRADLIELLQQPPGPAYGGPVRRDDWDEDLRKLYPVDEGPEQATARRATAIDQIERGDPDAAYTTLMASPDSRLHTLALEVQRFAWWCGEATNWP